MSYSKLCVLFDTLCRIWCKTLYPIYLNIYIYHRQINVHFQEYCKNKYWQVFTTVNTLIFPPDSQLFINVSLHEFKKFIFCEKTKKILDSEAKKIQILDIHTEEYQTTNYWIVPLLQKLNIYSRKNIMQMKKFEAFFDMQYFLYFIVKKIKKQIEKCNAFESNITERHIYNAILELCNTDLNKLENLLENLDNVEAAPKITTMASSDKKLSISKNDVDNENEKLKQIIALINHSSKKQWRIFHKKEFDIFLQQKPLVKKLCFNTLLQRNESVTMKKTWRHSLIISTDIVKKLLPHYQSVKLSNFIKDSKEYIALYFNYSQSGVTITDLQYSIGCMIKCLKDRSNINEINENIQKHFFETRKRNSTKSVNEKLHQRIEKIKLEIKEIIKSLQRYLILSYNTSELIRKNTLSKNAYKKRFKFSSENDLFLILTKVDYEIIKFLGFLDMTNWTNVNYKVS